MLAQRGELADAARLVRESLRLTEGVEFPDLRVAALGAAAEVESAQGRVEQALRLLDEARRIMKEKGNLVVLERLETALAEPVR